MTCCAKKHVLKHYCQTKQRKVRLIFNDLLLERTTPVILRNMVELPDGTPVWGTELDVRGSFGDVEDGVDVQLSTVGHHTFMLVAYQDDCWHNFTQGPYAYE
jgi:hypothetical protein